MRLVYLYLKNYIGIYNGLGVDKIEIDLSKAKHKICLIAGPNGTGKSTILKAANPLPDSNDSFVPNCDGEKVLIYADGDVTYRLVINNTCNNGKRSNEAFIYKNGTNLNPNGNVSSYKEVVFSEFGIDANFIAMSLVSSEDRGLADKTPAERKKIIASRIESLDAYNEMYKTLNKKANIFKSHLNSISSKLQNLGNRNELELRLAEIGKSEFAVTSSIEDNKRHIIEAQTRLSMMDANNVDEYLKAKDQYDEVESQIKDGKRSISQLSELLSDDDKTADQYRNEVANFGNSIAGYKGKKDYALSEIISIEADLERLNSDLQNIKNTDVDSSALSTALAAKKDKENDLNYLELDFKFGSNSRFVDIVNEHGLTYNEIVTVLKIANSVASVTIDHVPEDLDKDVISKINHYNVTRENIGSTIKTLSAIAVKMLDTLNDYAKNMVSIESDIERYKDKIGDITTQLEEYSIPSECLKPGKNKKCTYIEHHFELENLKEHYTSELNSTDERLARTKTEQEQIQYSFLVIQQTLERLKSLNALIQYLSIDERTVKLLCDVESVDNIIRSDVSTIQGYIDKIYGMREALMDLSNYLAERDRLICAINAIDSSMTKYQATLNNIERIENEIANLQKEKEKFVKDCSDIDAAVGTFIIMQNNARKKLEILEELQQDQNKVNELRHLKDQLLDKLAKLEKSGQEAYELQNTIASCQKIVDEAMARLVEISNEKKRVESQILIWDNFHKEYEEYNEKYNYVNVLRKYSSPTQGGIQSLFMSMYMNKTLDLSNQILSMLFKGQYRILDYTINENEFKIPFIGAGLMVDDISSGSTSQKCIMGSIISMVSNSSASPIYDIAMLDEVDGGLDQDNRMMFAKMIVDICDILKISQLFTISHSIEAAINNVDVILLSNDQNYIDQFANANVIYLYTGGNNNE